MKTGVPLMDEIVDRVYSKRQRGVTLRMYITELAPHAWHAGELTAAVVAEFDIPAEKARVAVDFLTDLPAVDPRG